MNYIRTASWTLSAALVATLLSGCGGGSKDGSNSMKENAAADQAVTLSIFFKCFSISDDEFSKFYVEPTKKKYPNITLEKIACGSPNQLKDMVVSRSLPDIIVDGVTNLNDLIDLDIPADLNEWIAANKLDMNRMNKQAVSFVKNFGKNGELYNMPIALNTFATYYNKDLFDMFGVSYPKDGMNWEEYIELAKKMTRAQNGVQYYGLQLGAFNRIPSQLSLSYVDKQSEKAVVQTAGWIKAFETWKTVHEISGNKPANAKDLYSGRNRFIKDKNVALFPDIAIPDGNLVEFEKSGGNWDIVSFPVFKDKPKVGTGVFANGMVIPKTGKYKDAAFLVISNLLSDAAQMEASKNGWMTVLNNADIQKRVYENYELYKGKNTKAFYFNELAAPYQVTKYDIAVSGKYTEALRGYVYGSKDLNTTLREAEEAANKEIAALKAK